jgi:hypothetical protein
MTLLADNAQRFTTLELITFSYTQLSDLKTSSSASTIPWLVDFRRTHGIYGYLTRYEQWMTYQRMAELVQESWTPYNPELRQSDIAGKQYNPITNTWDTPLRWRVSDYGLPYDKVKQFPLVGVDGFDNLRLSQSKFQPMPALEASGRVELIGEPKVEPIRGTMHKIGDIKVPNGNEEEVVKVIMTSETVAQVLEIELNKFQATIDSPVMRSGLDLFENIRSLINFQDFDRPVFAVSYDRTSHAVFVVYTELYKEDNIKTLKDVKIPEGNFRTFVSVKSFVVDFTMVQEARRFIFEKGIWTKFGPQFMWEARTATKMFMAGKKLFNGFPVYILSNPPKKIEDLLCQQEKYTPPLSLLPRMMEDPGLTKFAYQKFVIIDTEFVQVERNGGSQWICPLAALTVFEMSDRQTIAYSDERLYVDTSYILPHEFDQFKKCASIKWLVGNCFSDRQNGNSVNGGIPGFRRDVYNFHSRGFVIMAKGPRTEAIVLSDFGVTTPLPADHYNAGRTIIETRDEFGSYAQVKKMDHYYAGEPLKVYDLGGSKIEVLRNIYFDRFTWENFLTMYESGAKSRDHHPYYDVKCFAHHYLCNNYFSHLYRVMKFDVADIHMFFRKMFYNRTVAKYDDIFEFAPQPKLLISYEYGKGRPVRVNGNITLPPRDPFEGAMPDPNDWQANSNSSNSSNRVVKDPEATIITTMDLDD